MKDEKQWLETIRRQLGHSCNGKITEQDGKVLCIMDNGTVGAWMSPGKVRIIQLKRDLPKGYEGVETYKLESRRDNLVITRTVAGSLEIQTEESSNPSITVGQDKNQFGDINIFGSSKHAALYGNIIRVKV